MAAPHEIVDESHLNGEDSLKIDFSALKRIVAEKLGKHECIAICSFGEGTFNKIYLLTMEDGFQCIARLALPAFRRYKTESEVATMQYVAENTSIRVPKVYAWDSDPDNAIGAEYILMEKMNGVPLSEKWDHLAFEEKKHIINQVIDIMLQLLDTSFDRIGSLYMDENDSTYRIGPIISDLFFDGKRGTMDLERGPWGSTSEYLTAVIRAEVEFIKARYLNRDNTEDDAEDDDSDDDLDEEEVEDILRASEKLEKLVPLFSPTTTTQERFCLQHSDLHLGNIMVEGNEITSIIDWESSSTYPIWQGTQYPDFLVGRRISVKASDAINWRDQEDFQKLLDETNLRSYFKSELNNRNRAIGMIMQESGKIQRFRQKTILVRDFPGQVERWMEHLTNGSDDWDFDPMAPRM